MGEGRAHSGGSGRKEGLCFHVPWGLRHPDPKQGNRCRLLLSVFDQEQKQTHMLRGSQLGGLFLNKPA